MTYATSWVIFILFMPSLIFRSVTWQAVDANVLTGAATLVMKEAFQREPPSMTADPGKFFAGASKKSFPSGEATSGLKMT